LDFVQNSTVFMLRVQGDSMIEAGIFDNDYIVVKQQSTANNGDIVVALIDDEATVKTFTRKGFIRLQPANKFYDPIIVRDNLSILGKVIGFSGKCKRVIKRFAAKFNRKVQYKDKSSLSAMLWSFCLFIIIYV